MKRVLSTIVGCLILASFFTSCNESPVEAVEEETATQEEVWEPEVYATSELVEVMRKIEEDLKSTRQTVIEEQSMKARPAFYEEIKTAEPTEPEDITAIYMALADKLLEDYDAAAQAEGHAQVDKFNGMINTCVACHEQYCQGPIPKIKKLVIKQ